MWLGGVRREPKSEESESNSLGSGKSTQLRARTGTNDSWLKIEGAEGVKDASADIQVDEYELGEVTEKLLSDRFSGEVGRCGC